MRVLSVKHIEDCFDGSFIKELLLDEPISRDLILYLGRVGKLQYFPDFPRPFFKIDATGMTCKGIEGNNTIRVVVYEKNQLEELKAIIEQNEKKNS